MLEIDILGCGSSLGVPVIGCGCQVCKSDSIYNKRLRSSILIKKAHTKILIDFGFNIKEQLVNAMVDNLDAAILTHDHADHVSGIDNLRVFSFINNGKPLDIFVEENIGPVILNRYEYLFESNRLKMNLIKTFQELTIQNVKLQFFSQVHGAIESLGVKVEDFVYSCDVSAIPSESEKYLYNLSVWVVDCIDYNPSSNHAGLSAIMEWDQKYKPKQIYLTNMSHKLDYHELLLKLPKHIIPLYDGLKIKP